MTPPVDDPEAEAAAAVVAAAEAAAAAIGGDAVIPGNVHEEHEAKLKELHLSIYAAITNTLPRKVVSLKQPYHPAYMAAKVGELETVIGCLAGMLVKAGVLDQKDLVDMIGMVYAYDIQHLQLTASTVHTAKFLNDPPAAVAAAREEAARDKGDPDTAGPGGGP